MSHADGTDDAGRTGRFAACTRPFGDEREASCVDFADPVLGTNGGADIEALGGGVSSAGGGSAAAVMTGRVVAGADAWTGGGTKSAVCRGGMGRVTP